MAVFIMCGGAALAGLTDITFNLVGYFWVLVTSSPPTSSCPPAPILPIPALFKNA